MLAGNYFSIFLRVVKTSERPETANLDSMAGPHPELSWRILTRFWAFLNIASNFLGLSQMTIMITILLSVEIAITSIHNPLVGQTHSIPMKFFCQTHVPRHSLDDLRHSFRKACSTCRHRPGPLAS